MREGYDRVTTILSPFSGYGHIDRGVLERAADRGTKVHNMILALQHDLETFNDDDSLQGYIESYSSWVEGKKKFQFPERFYDDELMMTGECDCIYKDGDDLVLVDFKTSASINKMWPYQGSAYSYMAKKEGYAITKIEFVKLEKTGKPAKSFFYKEDMEDFRLLHSVYKRFFANSKEDMGDI